jgi:hypothetical protein
MKKVSRWCRAAIKNNRRDMAWLLWVLFLAWAFKNTTFSEKTFWMVLLCTGVIMWTVNAAKNEIIDFIVEQPERSDIMLENTARMVSEVRRDVAAISKLLDRAEPGLVKLADNAKQENWADAVANTGGVSSP